MALVCIFEGSDKGGDAEEMTDEKFKDLVIQYEKLVFTVCYQLVHDYHESQNLTQETFLAAYRHIDTYQGENYKTLADSNCQQQSKGLPKKCICPACPAGL